MLSADYLNVILDSLYQSLKEKIPKLRPPTLGTIEVIKEVGVHGSVVFGSLLMGDIDVKMTIVIDWETAMKLATKITKIDKVDVFDQTLIDALESVVHDVFERIMARCTQMGWRCEIVPLPMLIDSNVLLGAHSDSLVIKIPIQTYWQPIDLYLAFPKPTHEEKPDAA